MGGECRRVRVWKIGVDAGKAIQRVQDHGLVINLDALVQYESAQFRADLVPRKVEEIRLSLLLSSKRMPANSPRTTEAT